MAFTDRIADAAAALLGRPSISSQVAGVMDGGPKASFGESAWMGDGSSWIVRALGQGIKTDAGIGVSEWTAITLPAVYACVSIIADAIAMLPLNVYKRRSDNKGSNLDLDHPLNTLLAEQANEDMSAFDWRQITSHHALLWGNGYAEIERTRGGDPLALWPLYPDRTFPYKPFEEPLMYRTQIFARSIMLPPDDVFHVKALGFDGYMGYSPVGVARQAVGMGLAMEKFGGKFFANDSKSGGFLLHPGKLGDNARDNVQKSFTEQGGNDNAFKVKVLEEGMKFISTTIPPDDAQFLASREFQVAEIARIYRVPLVLLQSMEKATSWGSGIEQIMIGFIVWTIQPWILRFEQELNRKLLTAKERKSGLFIKFNLRALSRGDMAARSNFYRVMWGLGAMNPNEIREHEDMNPYDGGDAYRVPMNFVDTDDDEDDDTDPAGLGVDDDDPATLPPMNPGQQPAKPAEETGEDGTPTPDKSVPQNGKRRPKRPKQGEN
jgi:HK97 family phage portal protein